MAKKLAGSSTATVLSVSCPSLGDEGLLTLLPGLVECSSLRRIEFNACSITDAGAGALAAALALSRSKPHELALTRNDISRGETAALLLRSVPSLRALSLSGNRIDSVTEIAHVICDRTCFLQALHLRDNKVSNHGVVELTRAARAQPRFVGVDLRQNLVDDHTALGELAVALGANAAERKARALPSPMQTVVSPPAPRVSSSALSLAELEVPHEDGPAEDVIDRLERLTRTSRERRRRRNSLSGSLLLSSFRSSGRD